ncbi:MAG: protein kinase [Thiotrichaceae bacterium]|nr:protein kinase [Thiotrichaceae bacterium]
MRIRDRFWEQDRVIGLAVGSLFALLFALNGLQGIDQILYQLSLRSLPTPALQTNKVAVLAIDTPSIQQLGDYPWSRNVYAQLIDKLAPYSKAIAFTQDFSQPHTDPALPQIEEMLAYYAQDKGLATLPEQLHGALESLGKLRARAPDSVNTADFAQLIQAHKNINETLTTLEDKLYAVRMELDSDQRLAYSVKKAGNVFFGMPVQTQVATPLPAYLAHFKLATRKLDPDEITQDLPNLLSSQNFLAPIAALGETAAGVGFLPSPVQGFSQPLISKVGTMYLPSLPLLLAAKARSFEREHLEVRLEKRVRLAGALRVAHSPDLSIQPPFNPNVFTVDSVADLWTGKISPEKFRDKVVLIGVTAPAFSTSFPTPVGNLPSVFLTAHAVNSLLNQVIIQPAWSVWVQVGAWLAVVLFLSLLLPKIKFPQTALLWVGGLAGVIYGIYLILLSNGYDVPMGFLLLILIVGQAALWIKNSIIAYQDAFRLHPDAIESNRLLGLALQGQGQLDMAFEKFRLCPPDPVILSLLYNLALDYELKRYPRGAGAVYRYILKNDMNFRDVERRLDRLNHARPASFNPRDCLLADETGEKPTIGRYQIERQLGRGAMGIVYLGKEPKLDRLVAIKTLALSQEFDGFEFEEAIARFFREATAAGRLQHPHIISTYDAGEQNDLAYISMEFFKGGSLVPFTKTENLLPVPTVMKIVHQVALALDYAHQQGVIHRDIKPANIMYNPATEDIKITDFGIAHITDSNKTKTGIFLGSPSYMSPEQLASKQIDGRADLYSLGVTLYQLLTGQLPFQGADSMAALIFKITHEPYFDVLEVRPDLPICMGAVVDKALQKNALNRFQSGAEFAQALCECAKIQGDTPMQVLQECCHFKLPYSTSD